MIWIDGHNVLRTVPELNNLYRKDHVTAMQRLIGRAKRDRDAIVVFDGKPVHELVAGGVKVVFVDDPNTRFEQADRYILQHSRNDPTTIVVTFDQELMRVIRERRGTVISPIDWFQTPEKQHYSTKPHRNTSKNNDQKKHPGISASEYINLLRNRNSQDDDK